MSDVASPVQPPMQPQASAEAQAIDRVVEVLRGRFPGLPAQLIKRKVDQARVRFTGAPVRDFVPVLVERQVGAELTANAAFG